MAPDSSKMVGLLVFIFINRCTPYLEGFSVHSVKQIVQKNYTKLEKRYSTYYLKRYFFYSNGDIREKEQYCLA